MTARSGEQGSSAGRPRGAGFPFGVPGLSGLSDTDALTVTLKLETTGDKLVGFAKESGDTLDPAVAQKIATAAVVFESKTSDGTHFRDVKPGSKVTSATSLVIQDDGKSLAELRVVNNALYAQADVKTLLALFQQKTAYADLSARVAQMPAFAQAFVQGKWVSLDLNALKALAGQFGGANASPSSQQTQKLLADLKVVLGKDVTATADCPSGTSNATGADHSSVPRRRDRASGTSAPAAPAQRTSLQRVLPPGRSSRRRSPTTASSSTPGSRTGRCRSCRWTWCSSRSRARSSPVTRCRSS